MIKTALNHSALRQIVLFGMVGGIGFIADTLVLYLLKGTIGLYWARLFSFVAAVWVTWLLNRSFTFHEKRYRQWNQEFAYYFLCMIGGGMINLVVYILLVSQSAASAQYPIIGVAAGSIAGMVVNFLSAKFFIFKSRKN
ncbi:GtrA family protein [Neisseria dentiae]|uniref:GtrA family protein n=1 Tax=Neisseria dentiae TaxID=194197 RepID=UPI00211CA755|nr:GtrA family protein [Neisseria dentiae]MCQ9326674.1 GtrA family protein [Neisseria dentiae]